MMKRTWMSSFPLPDTRGLGLIWFLVFYFTCSFVLSKFCSECELIDVSSTVFLFKLLICLKLFMAIILCLKL